MLIALLALSGLLLAGLVAVNVAYIRHLEVKDRRHDDQVGRLLQRIQAPEQAVIEHVAQPSDGPRYRNPWDDERERLEHALAGVDE